jgi:hypothetical protein
VRKRTKKISINGQQGAILITLVVTIVIMAVLASGMLYYSTTSSYGGLFANRTSRAYYLAESGADFAVQQFIAQNKPENGPFPDPSPSIFTLSNGWFSVKTYEKPDDSARLIVEATGIVGSGWLTTRQLVTRDVDKSNPDGGGGGGTEFVEYLVDNNVFVYGSELVFSGNNVSGPDSTIVIKGDLNTSDLNRGASIAVTTIYIDGDVDLNGGSAGLGSSTVPGTIYINGSLELWNGGRDIYGDVYVNGDFRLKDAHIHGNVYVNGNVELGWTPTLDANSRIFYTGTLTHPNYYSESILAKCIKQDSVPGFTMPDYEIPEPKSSEWFTEHGYQPAGDLVNDLKIYTEGDYTSSSWRPDTSNVIIVSEGDISITGMGGSTLTGVLYAPNGKVTFGGGSFIGFVVSEDGFSVTRGGTSVSFKGIADFISDPDEYPFSQGSQGSQDTDPIQY